MSNKIFDTNWIWAGAVVMFLVGGGAAHFSDQFFLAYPLDQWRMDLDDFLGNIGTFMVGLAALWGIDRAKKGHEAAKEAVAIAKRNGHKEHELEKREENDFQQLRAEISRLVDKWEVENGSEK